MFCKLKLTPEFPSTPKFRVFAKNIQNLLQNSEYIGYGIDSAFSMGQITFQRHDLWLNEDCLKKFVFGKLFRFRNHTLESFSESYISLMLSWPAWGSSSHGHGLPTWAVGMDMCFLRKIMTQNFSKPSFGNSDGLKIDFQSVKYNKPVEYALCSRKVHDDINFGFFPANHFWPLGWP